MEKSLFEQQGGSYHWEGDYLIPDLVAPEAPKIGLWGQRRRKFLKEHRRTLYNSMLYSGSLNAHLEDVDKSAAEMFDRLVKQMAAQQGITEALKAQNQLTWVGAMNSIILEVTKVVFKEEIYS